MKMLDSGDYRGILRDELGRRRSKNSHYSQAAFARDIGVSPGRLSDILRGKQGLSPSTAVRIAGRLGFSQQGTGDFVDLVRTMHARDPLEREEAKRRVEKSRDSKSYRSLRTDSFKVISDWYHLAIIELTKVEGFKSSSSWISKKLRIGEQVVVDAVERLKRVGLLTVKEGWIVPTSGDNSFPGGVPSECIKKFHAQSLKLASKALYDQRIENREFSTTFIAINREKLPLLKKRVDEFWKAIDREMGGETKRSDVYCLGIQFFNLTEGAEDA